LTKVPVALWDERKAKDQRGKVDRVAAAMLLQSYLDAQSASVLDDG
jgi:RNase H-fold protein (predicted Holliday junction resolvase)